MKYNVVAQDANLNEYLVLSGIDEASLDEFVHDYCDDEVADSFGRSYRWLKEVDLPEYDLPHRTLGWIVRFIEVET